MNKRNAYKKQSQTLINILVYWQPESVSIKQIPTNTRERYRNVHFYTCVVQWHAYIKLNWTKDNKKGLRKIQQWKV